MQKSFFFFFLNLVVDVLTAEKGWISLFLDLLILFLYEQHKILREKKKKIEEKKRLCLYFTLQT